MNDRNIGYGLVTFAVLLWAGNAIVGRLAPDSDVPPIALNFWRWIVAFLVLLPFAWPKLRAQRDLFRAHWWLWVVFGVVTVAGFNATFYIGLQYTTAVQGTLITASMPILVLIAARIFFSQPITARQLIGVLISIVGVGIIVARGDSDNLSAVSLNQGDAWMLVATAMWAAQIILIRYLPKGMDLVAFQVASFVVGLVVLSPFVLGESLGGRPMPISWNAALYVGYTGIIASVMGFTCWNMGVIRIGPKAAGYFGNLFPVFGAALGILLLGESFESFHAVGGIVILGGIYLATYSRATPAAAPG